MEKPSFKLVGAPCGQHGQYTFYKAIRLTIGEKEKIVAIGDFFFVRIWQDSELVSVGELQLLWTDRVSDQTLVSLRLYFLPENTPDGRNQHGTDEVLAINDKVVVRAEDLLSWVCDGTGWRWGLRAVWRGACAPPQEQKHTQPLHHTKLDFTDVEKEKSAIVDNDSPGVVVFSYPRYCRYRALLSRLEGIQGDWLRDSLVAALGGYAAPTTNTRILYCKDTFEYPELEGHEFVCNELAPKLKGRPRGKRRRASPDASDRSESDHDNDNVRTPTPQTPRRLSLRNGGEKHSEDEEDTRRDTAEEKSFLTQLRQFHRDRGDSCPLEDLSLRSLYRGVKSRGGYEAVCRQRLWRALSAEQPARARRHYERYLLPYEKHENRRSRNNGRMEPRTVETIELDDDHKPPTPPPTTASNEVVSIFFDQQVELRANTTEDTKEELNLISKPAEELNREFLDSLPKEEKQEKPMKISVKPVEKLIEGGVKKLFEEDTKVKEAPDEKPDDINHKNAIVKTDSVVSTEGSEVSSSLSSLSSLSDKYVNGHDHQKSSRPAGRSSLRAVRVKPARPSTVPPTSAPRIVRSESGPTINNFGIHRPPPITTSADDDIVEVPYKPKSPEIIDLDEYPESPQSVKKKRLDILKERGLEVTAVPAWPLPNPQLAPLMNRTPMLINPAMQHQIMTQAQLFQMYNILPASYNGLQPPKVIQATSIFGSCGPEKTVYGNPKDPFMPPPHVLHGAPLKPSRTVQSSTPPQDILDLTCKTGGAKPAVEIVRVPTAPSPSKTSQNPKNYTLLEGKAVVGSNLEITLVNPKAQTPSKTRPTQKRSSNGKFVSSKTPTPPKEPPRPFPSPSGVKKNPIVVPNYQINSRDNVSPTSSTGSRESVGLGSGPLTPSLGVGMGMGVGVGKGLEPGYLHALYGGAVVPHLDPRHLAAYRDVLADQLRGYSGLLLGAATGTPTTKN